MNFFSKGHLNRSTESRISILQKQNLSPEFSEGYRTFGYDYFDNCLIDVGYGGYFYDGRYRNSVSELCEYYRLKPGNRIIEIGCAKGHILVEFFKLGMQVAGIDLSEYAVMNANTEIRDSIFIGDVCALPFNDNTFDFLLCKEVLPHLKEAKLDRAILECLRVSKSLQFFEIQSGRTDLELNLLKKWDITHQTLRPPEWWNGKLKRLGFEGDVNYKILFPEDKLK
jgi:protein-L-isoaspartate(D-aspartate) O-methyltransferase